MDLFELIWDASQGNQIARLRSEVDKLKREQPLDVDPLRQAMHELRQTNGELKLYVATLFRILEMKGIIAREDLARLVDQIDEEDGRRDNSYSGDALP
jgi:hypothetical protein